MEYGNKYVICRKFTGKTLQPFAASKQTPHYHSLVHGTEGTKGFNGILLSTGQVISRRIGE